jgi:pimeloyl-ACP methyl ester carboxylesterase
MEWIIDGATAYAYTGGKMFNPSLPCVMLIHGAQNDHSVWALQSRYLAHHGYGVLALDLPGHGNSTGAPLASIEALAQWMVKVQDAAGVTRAALVGHSMGSLVALEAASLAPERVSHLALFGTAFPMKVSDALLASAASDDKAAMDMVTPWLQYGIAQKPGCPGPGSYLPAAQRRLMQRIAARNPAYPVYLTDFTACNAYANGLTAAGKIRCPTLFVSGACDVMTPARAAQGLVAAMREAGVTVREQVLAECGHSLMAEQPDQVLRILLAALQTKQSESPRPNE